ncbi:hypothetical protein [Luteibacter jiangsuensis]
MNSNDPNLLVVELAAIALGSLLDELVLVGGCAVGLLITDTNRPPIRYTVDVDLVAEVTTKIQYYQLSERLKSRGFRESEEVICRFHRDQLIVDVMPVDASVLGFSNEWYELAIQRAAVTKLRTGHKLRHVSAPLLLATKLASFIGRGNGDYMHHDIEDVINLVDGRQELVAEVEAENDRLRQYVREEVDDLLADPEFTRSIGGHFHPTEDHAERTRIVIGRLRSLAGL